MPIDQGNDRGTPRRPSLKGRVMFDTLRGQERVRSWPRKRGTPKSPVVRENNELFRQYQWATKFWPAGFVIPIMDAVKGTPYLPRDLMTMIMAGRLWQISCTDGTVIYSIEQIRDVSEVLDVINRTPGLSIIRGEQYWEPFEPGYSRGPAPWLPPDPDLFTYRRDWSGVELEMTMDMQSGALFEPSSIIGLGAPLGRFQVIPADNWQATWYNFTSIIHTGINLAGPCAISAHNDFFVAMALGHWGGNWQHLMRGRWPNTLYERWTNPWQAGQWGRFRVEDGLFYAETSVNGRQWTVWRRQHVVDVFAGSTPTHVGFYYGKNFIHDSDFNGAICPHWKVEAL